MKHQPKICVIGSINLDFVIRTQTLPIAGETLGGGEFITTPGGKGANQALAAQRLGAEVSMLGCIGDDQYGQIAMENLRSDGVDITQVRQLENSMSGAAFINLSADGENQIAVAPGANTLFQPEHLPPLSGWDAVIAQLEIPTETIAAAVQGSESFFCLNAAPAKPMGKDLLSRANLLVVNELEYAYYRDQLEGYKGMLACTYGSKGAALFVDGTEIASSASFKVDVVDTTGAGDCFTAALTVFLMEGLEPDVALKQACACAGLATTKTGAQAGMPWRTEAESFFVSAP